MTLRWRGEWGELQEQEIPWCQLDRGAGRGALDEATLLWNSLTQTAAGADAGRESSSDVGPAGIGGARRSARLRGAAEVTAEARSADSDGGTDDDEVYSSDCASSLSGDSSS